MSNPVFGAAYNTGGVTPTWSTLSAALGTLQAGKFYSVGAPSSYSTIGVPAGCTMPIICTKYVLAPSYPYLSSSAQSALASFYRSLPLTGRPVVVLNQEGESARFGYSAAQVVGSQQEALSIFKSNAPMNALFAQDFETYSASNYGRGSAFKSYVCPGLPLYLIDWYPTTNSTDAIDSASPAVAAIEAVSPGAAIGVAECNVTTGTGITWNGGDAQWFSVAWNYSVANAPFCFVVYYNDSHNCVWPPSAAAVSELASFNSAPTPAPPPPPPPSVQLLTAQSLTGLPSPVPVGSWGFTGDGHVYWGASSGWAQKL